MRAIETAMRPYDLNRDDDGPGEWDHWTLRSDSLQVRPEHDGDPRILFNPTWPDGSPRQREALQCDGAPVALLDLDRIEAAEVAEAKATWAVWSRFAAQHPPARPLSAFDDQDPAQAKYDHLAQPLVQALAQHAITAGDPHYPMSMATHDPIALFAGDERTYLASAASLALATRALLTTDGRWVDVFDPTPLGPPTPSESPSGAYLRLAAAYRHSLPPDALIAHLRCHC
jgi:hypothetical protein